MAHVVLRPTDQPGWWRPALAPTDGEGRTAGRHPIELAFLTTRSAMRATRWLSPRGAVSWLIQHAARQEAEMPKGKGFRTIAEFSKRTALGRGLDALLPPADVQPDDDVTTFQQVQGTLEFRQFKARGLVSVWLPALGRRPVSTRVTVTVDGVDHVLPLSSDVETVNLEIRGSHIDLAWRVRPARERRSRGRRGVNRATTRRTKGRSR